MTPPLSAVAEAALPAQAASSVHSDEAAEITTAAQASIVIDLGQARGHVASHYERLIKPVIDRLGGLLLLVAAAPVMLLCAAAVAATLGRPVLLRQPRIGHRGQEFVIYKLRTMHPSRRSRRLDYVGPERRKTHKHPNDPRLTRLGRWLRTWSLDELPQLINVVRGQMSLVGPRPEMIEIVDRYEAWQHRRHDVKPGVTGLWQVSARGDAPMHELTHVDLEYLQRVSLWTDLRILALTLPAALGMRRGF